MNALSSPTIRWFLLLLVALWCFVAGAGPVSASDHASMQTTTTPVLTLRADVLKDVLGNRSRMIQFSLGCVVFGCALLWWRR